MKVDICNIWNQKCFIEIQKGVDFICPRCNGHGAFIYKLSYKTRKYAIDRCSLCKGDGKVDWVTNITGHRPPECDDYDTYDRTSRYLSLNCRSGKGCKKITRLWKEQLRNKKQLKYKKD